MADQPEHPESADTSETATLEAARAHARAQADAAALAAAGASQAAVPDGVSDEQILWRSRVGGGNYESTVLRRGDVLRLVDVDGDACVQLLLFRKDNPAERLNVADTVKVQWQAYLSEGAVLLSDMGRVLATIVSDTSGRHDCICGGTTARTATAKWGNGSASGPTPNARDLLVLGAAKHGLTRRDVGPHVDLFKSVRVADDGSLHFDGDAAPGRHVDLRFEVDVIVVVANTPHPLDPRAGYEVTDLALVAWRAARPEPDPYASSTPERARAFENTARLLAGLGA